MKFLKLQSIFISLLLLCSSRYAISCPVFIESVRLPGRSSGAWAKNHESIRFYAFQPDRSVYPSNRLEEPWVSKPLQIDFLDDNGRLFISGEAGDKSKSEGKSAALRSEDRLSLHAGDFSGRRDPKTALPCKAQRAIEVVRHDAEATEANRFGYLMLCAKDAMPELNTKHVQYYPENAFLRSSMYEYFFDSNNHMLFRNILLKQLGVFVPVAKNSDLLIKADIKYFFTMLFKPSDVNSVLETYQSKPLSVIGALSFYLKILFFKVRLSLTTDVSFFEDSVYIPMNVHLPEGSKERLKPGSGIVYSWQNLLGEPVSIDMPRIQLGNLPNLKEVEAKYCHFSECIFSLTFKLNQEFLKMFFKLNVEQVRQSFFPSWIEDMNQKSFHAFGLGKPDASYFHQRIGSYFETSELNDGNHGWDFWLSMVKHENTQCPMKTAIVEIAK